MPTLLSKKSYRNKNEYLTTSNGEIETLVMTNVDLELFLKHYEIYDLEYHEGYKFKGIKHLFDKFIEYWSQVKINSKKNGNHGMYLIAKLMLNSLYGKFGLNPNMGSKTPYLSEERYCKISYRR